MNVSAPGLNLHIFLTRAKNESRFLREASSLTRSGLVSEVVLAALWDDGLAEAEPVGNRVTMRRLRLATHRFPKGMPWHLVRGLEWKTRVVRLAEELRPATLQAHSLYALGAAVKCRRRLAVPLIYDAHELETERNGLAGFKKRIEQWWERRLIRHCDGVICVSDTIADWYARSYGITRPAVVRNIPDVRTQASSEDRGILRRRFGIKDEALVFLYQGGLFAGRRIEQFLRVFAQAGPTRHVVFMGYGELEGLVRETAARHSNIHFLPAVPPGEVLRHTVGADVGLVGVENVCLSYYYCLPNKFFEYLLAGIPVLANDWPEMGKVVREHGCGWLVGEGEANWLAAVQRVNQAEVEAARVRAGQAARNFSWENEEKVLLEVYRQVLS